MYRQKRDGSVLEDGQAIQQKEQAGRAENHDSLLQPVILSDFLKRQLRRSKIQAVVMSPDGNVSWQFQAVFELVSADSQSLTNEFDSRQKS
jgi:hypothetical protein